MRPAVLWLCAGIALLTAIAADAQSRTSLDYRGIYLAMPMDEFDAAIAARNQGSGTERRAICILNDFSKPNPNQYECEDPQDTARYYFSEDDQQPRVMRLRRIVVPGSRDDFTPFVAGVDRRFAGSTVRVAIPNGVRWALGKQTVTVKRPPCNEEIAGIVYSGTCAVYLDQRLQSLFNARRGENQRREF